MKFYTSIADIYDSIFPLNQAQVQFVQQSFNNQQNRLNILDVGCGTGNLTLALAKKFNSIVGIDLDSEMLKMAQLKPNTGNVQFKEGNMVTLTNQFLPNEFDGIICFGNTVVHLDSLLEIDAFLKQSHTLLKENGKLLIQIINYDRILNENIDHLPTIENDNVKFERIYEYLREKNKIRFKTVLNHKLSNKTVNNEQLLFPITEIEMVKLLIKNGFEILNRYGSFKKEKIKVDSLHLIIEAKKS